MRLIGRLATVALLSLSPMASALAQQPASPPAGQSPPQTDEQQATPSPLAVGSLAIASDAAISVDSMSVDVVADKVTYSYKLRNKGQDKRSLAASIALPDLEVSSDGSAVYLLPSENADNFVGLDVKSGGKAVATTSNVQAVALGVDRHAELAASGVPLIPFGDATDKALAGTNPETITRLESLGLVTPRDPAQPKAPVAGDWTLHVVHSWMQDLDPNVVTTVDVAFQPIKAIYTIDASSLAGFDALKDQACLTPQIMGAVKALLTAKDSTVDVADLLIANEGPARWLQNPQAAVAVHKPTPSSVIAFCGLDAKTQGTPTVTGVMPNSGELAALRVLIFARSDGK